MKIGRAAFAVCIYWGGAKLRRVGCIGEHNELQKFWFTSVKGFQGCERSISVYCHRLSDPSLQQCYHYRAARDGSWNILLRCVRPTAADGDDIAAWLLRSCSYELAEIIFNCSFSSGTVTSHWLNVLFISIPKVTKLVNLSDFRPIWCAAFK